LSSPQLVLTELAPTEHYTLSLHDALPIWLGADLREKIRGSVRSAGYTGASLARRLDLPEHRIHDTLYRRNRRPTRLPVLVIQRIDRKSTRLNSSHGSISYAVFCLKKKTLY